MRPQCPCRHVDEEQDTTRGIREICGDTEMPETEVLPVGLVSGYVGRHRDICV